MADSHPSQSPDDASEAIPPENDLTVDLTQEEFGDVDDLQALADEMADYDPEGGEVDGAPGPEPGELDALRSRVEFLEKAEADHIEKHHRLLADFANHRNRVGRDTQMAVAQAERRLLLEILPVLDSFDRCVSATYTSVEDFHAGVLLIQKQMNEALRKAGVEPLPLKVGDPFDAQHAEALTTTTQPSLPDGSVAAIFERGFTHRDQLLRPARVIVNNNPDGDSTQQSS